MGRRPGRPRSAEFGRQSVANTPVGRDLIQIQEIVIAGERPLERAVRLLAESVGARLTAEVQRWELESPAPITLRVRTTERPVQARPEAVFGEARPPLEGTSAQIIELFQGLPHRQLVILGEPGAGKTALTTLLAHELLRGRSPDDPVPVLFPLSSWRPETPLRSWMAARLLEEHPWLDDDRDVAGRLLDTGRIMPVLDGLDEITAPSFENVLKKVDLALDRGTPFVLTCRAAEYEDAVREFGHHLSRAAVVEIDEVKANEARTYLEESVIDDERWRPLLDRLRDDPEGPLAQALATPLMLFLLRTAYSSPRSDPGVLLTHAERERIETALLDAFLPAVYADHLHPPYREDEAQRWLGTLAAGPRELHWWNFTTPAADVLPGILFALGSGWIFHLLWGVWTAAIGGAVVWIGTLVLNAGFLENRVEIVATEREAADPRSHLRRYLVLATLFAAGSGIAVGAGLATWFSGALGASPEAARFHALIAGVFFGAATLFSTAWGRYFLSGLWLALRGRLPFRLAPFIEDAHARGVLRRPHAVPEFRHARLQDRLKPHGSASLVRQRHVVVPAATPRLRRVTALFAVPVLRLCADVFAVLLTAFLISSLLTSVPMAHESGAKPGRYARGDCAGSDPCILTEYLSWSLPPGTRVTSVFRPGRRVFKAPYQGLNGGIYVTDCPKASITMNVEADGSPLPHAVTLRAGGRNSLDSWSLPADFTTLSFVFRRLDAAPCTAHLEWEAPSLATDGLFFIKNRFA